MLGKAIISKLHKGRVFTDEHKLKLSLARKGLKRSEEFKKRASDNSYKKRRVIELNSGVLYSSATEAAVKLGINPICVARAARRRKKIL